MADFNTFMMEDAFGGCFFHFLLDPILASILGVIGGVVKKARDIPPSV
jgi:hypothetical protein